MGRAVRQFEKEATIGDKMRRTVRQCEKEASLRLGTGVEYVAWNCMGHAVRQFEKRSYF